MNMTYRTSASQKDGSESSVDAVVVGAGLGGLTAAALLAQQGQRVVVLERSEQLGGRGMTQSHEGHLFNLGAHALYRSGHALQTFRRLGLRPKGRIPSTDANQCMWEGRIDWLPGGPKTFWRSRVLTRRQKWRLIGLFVKLFRADTEAWAGRPLREWIDAQTADPILRGFLEATFRVSNYANAPELQSAGAALAQLKRALRANVLYLDDGWQQLVDGLRDKILAAGGVIKTGTSAREVLLEEGQVIGVVDGAGQQHLAPAVILATPPAAALKLLSDDAAHEVGAWVEALRPVKASCLDVTLSTLPVAERRFVLGLDQPYYFSVHTTYASLYDESASKETRGEVIHIMKYLPPADASGEAFNAKQTEAELEAFLDKCQPGWREKVQFRRFLPQMTVVYDTMTPERATQAPRGPAVKGADGLYVIGDWIGNGAMLLDASVASAATAVGQIMATTKALGR